MCGIHPQFSIFFFKFLRHSLLRRQQLTVKRLKLYLLQAIIYVYSVTNWLGNVIVEFIVIRECLELYKLTEMCENFCELHY